MIKPRCWLIFDGRVSDKHHRVVHATVNKTVVSVCRLLELAAPPNTTTTTTGTRPAGPHEELASQLASDLTSSYLDSFEGEG